MSKEMADEIYNGQKKEQNDKDNKLTDYLDLILDIIELVIETAIK